MSLIMLFLAPSNNLPLIAGLSLAICMPKLMAANSEEKEEESEKPQIGWFIPANTPAKNFYVAFGVGFGDSDSPDSNQDGSVSNISDDETDRTLGFRVGYQINERYAVQGGYKDLGETDFRGDSTGGPSWTAGPVRTEQDADGWELGILGRWPISQRWYALGFLGWYWWENNEKYTEGSFVSTVSQSGGDATVALGFEFDHGLKDRIVYRFMGSHHQVGDDNYDVNDVAAEVVYRFP